MIEGIITIVLVIIVMFLYILVDIKQAMKIERWREENEKVRKVR